MPGACTSPGRARPCVRLPHRVLTSADLNAIADAVADELQARGLVARHGQPPATIMTAAQVAAMLGRSRDWVYAHADELGGFRLGHGPRARLGFQRSAVDRWIREHLIDSAPGPEHRPARRRRSAPDLQHVELIPFEDG